MNPSPVQTFLAWCSWFTFGVALLSTTIPALIPFGIVFTLLGLAPFVNERVAFRFLPLFFVLLGISLLSVIQSLHLDGLLPTSAPKPPIWYVSALIVAWGSGIFWGFRRWKIARLNKKNGSERHVS